MDNTECILFSLKKIPNVNNSTLEELFVLCDGQLVLVVPDEMFIEVNKRETMNSCWITSSGLLGWLQRTMHYEGGE